LRRHETILHRSIPIRRASVDLLSTGGTDDTGLIQAPIAEVGAFIDEETDDLQGEANSAGLRRRLR
jgi:hypothetical protein